MLINSNLNGTKNNLNKVKGITGAKCISVYFLDVKISEPLSIKR